MEDVDPFENVGVMLEDITVPSILPEVLQLLVNQLTHFQQAYTGILFNLEHDTAEDDDFGREMGVGELVEELAHPL